MIHLSCLVFIIMTGPCVWYIVIRADLAENDNTVKHNDRRAESKRGEEGEKEMREKERESESRKNDMQNAHAHTAVRSDSVV